MSARNLPQSCRGIARRSCASRCSRPALSSHFLLPTPWTCLISLALNFCTAPTRKSSVQKNRCHACGTKYDCACCSRQSSSACHWVRSRVHPKLYNSQRIARRGPPSCSSCSQLVALFAILIRCGQVSSRCRCYGTLRYRFHWWLPSCRAFQLVDHLGQSWQESLGLRPILPKYK